MSTVEDRKPKRRLTFRDLIMAAQSHDATVRKQAYMAYNAWVKAAARIPSADRLTQMQRDVMTKIFMDKGFIKPGSVDARTRAK